MPRYEVSIKLEYFGEVEADNREQAEDMALSWDDNLNFFGVDSIEVAELEDEDEDDEE
jgi:hypothetical protein